MAVSKIPTCEILGVNVAAIDMEWLIQYTQENIVQMAENGKYMCVANVHTTVTAYENENYRAVQNGSIIAIPDGGPLSSVGRKRGYKNMRRITGPSYMEEILRLSMDRGYRHYFFGSTPETQRKMWEVLNERYPGIQIVGMYSPPFRPLTEEEDKRLISEINEASPDFLWVGLGAPKQEIWMADHEGKVHGFMIGVGAGFDYIAGNIQRAPQWMQNNNLEWLFRLIQEPQRLFCRYWNTNWKFIWNAYIRGR